MPANETVPSTPAASGPLAVAPHDAPPPPAVQPATREEAIESPGNETPPISDLTDTPEIAEVPAEAPVPVEDARPPCDDAVPHDPTPSIPRTWIDRSPSNEFGPAPEVLVPRSAYRRLDRLTRSVDPSLSPGAVERVYTEALTLGLESLAVELQIVGGTNDLRRTPRISPRRPAARSFARLRRTHVPVQVLRALRVVTAAGLSQPERFPNAVAVHGEALRRGVETLEGHPELLDLHHDRRPSRRRPIHLARAIGA